MVRADLLRQVFEAKAAYNELGNAVVEEVDARFVHNAETPNVHDSNLACLVRAETDDEIDRVLARADEIYAPLRHRKVMVDLDTPPAFEARLVLDGYEPHPHVELMLEGELQASAAAVDIRLVESDADWRSLTELWHLSHEEDVEKGRYDPWDFAVSAQMVRAKVLKAPDLRFWMARVDDTDAAHFSSWPGRDGVGIVEDLFTRPEFRHRGIATALIVHSVADARARGVSPVLITARADDTPKYMYAALGFRP
ncbi:MAG TPA: GNAT family N-acetyltransferase, partial [Acidimicrobiia bacterium]|nr:GNAT family N-acetyltransferase [Acidimicrobiia bacterium]